MWSPLCHAVAVVMKKHTPFGTTSHTRATWGVSHTRGFWFVPPTGRNHTGWHGHWLSHQALLSQGILLVPHSPSSPTFTTSCWGNTPPPPSTPQPFLFGSCSLPGFLLSLLQLSPVHHWKISLLPSFLFNNSGMSPKPLSQTDRPQHSLCWWHPEWKAKGSLHFVAQWALQEIFFISPLKSLEMPRNYYSDSTQVLSLPLPSVFILYQWAT